MSQQSKRKSAKRAVVANTSVSAWRTEAFLRFATGLTLVVGIYILASLFGI